MDISQDLDTLHCVLSYCPLCGSNLTSDPDGIIKKCPAGHGIAYTFEGPDGNPAIMFEPEEWR